MEPQHQWMADIELALWKVHAMGQRILYTETQADAAINGAEIELDFWKVQQIILYTALAQATSSFTCDLLTL